MLLYLSDSYLYGMTLWLILGAFSFWLLLRLRGSWRHRPNRLTWINASLINASLSLWFGLSLLTAVELYFALIYDTSDSFNMTNVSKKWFKLHVEPQQRPVKLSDQEGVVIRDDRDYPTQIAPDQKHIVFLGDSFTFAQGVPNVSDRFSNRVRAELEPASKGKLVVSNLSDAGTDLHWVERVLEVSFENRHRIDVPIYVMCLNDIETFHERHKTYYQDLGKHGPSHFLFRETYFFNWVYFRVRQATLPDVRGYFSFVQDYYAGEPWERMSRKLRSVHQLCQQNHADFRIVLFPFLHNLGPDYPFREAHQRVVAFCQEEGIPILDLEPELTPSASKGLTINRFDAHPNELAHRIAADAIMKKLLADVAKAGDANPSAP